MPSLGPESAFIFRITHVDNVAWILRHGLHCATSKILDPDFVQIGSRELIQKQRDHPVSIPPGGVFGDYVRFYFTPWSIMLFNIKTGFHGIKQRENREVAILVSSLHKVSEMGLKFVFTDHHAYGKESTPYNDLKHLDKIDWNLLRAKDFKNDPEDPGKKGRYQAEALVHRKVPVEAILGITCYDTSVQARFAHAAQEAGVQTKIRALPKWYF